MNELDIIETLPHGDGELAQKIAAVIVVRTRELSAKLDALEITADNYAAADILATLEEVGNAAEDIRERAKRLVRAALDAVDATRIIKQIDPRLTTYSTKQDPLAAYSLLTGKLKKLEDQRKAFADADRPKAPTRAIPILIYATDKAAADLADKIRLGKLGGVDGYRFAPDEATERKIVKLMEANNG